MTVLHPEWRHPDPPAPWVRPLRAAPLEQAAQWWRDRGRRVEAALAERTAPAVDRLADGGAAPWSGEAVAGYHEHLARLAQAARTVAALAARAAAALDGLAAAARAAERHLDESYARVLRDPRTLRRETRLALALRHDLAGRRDECRRALRDLLPGWQSLAAGWSPAARGVRAPFPLPDDPGGLLVVRDGRRVLVSTGAGDDRVRVTEQEGELVVSLAGRGPLHLPAGTELLLRLGAGDDTAEIASAAGVTVLGGAGRDVLRGGDGADLLLGLGGRDTVLGGAGDDLLSGGGERDYLDGGEGGDLLSGGEGDDTGYGMAGADRLLGGPGRDYLEGSAGDDLLNGGPAADVLSGGDGGTSVTGPLAGGDADRLIAGAAWDAWPVQVRGTPQFAARVGADLDMLRGTVTGRAMLDALARALAGSDGWLPGDRADTITISELPLGSDNGFAGWDGDTDRHLVSYEPTFDELPGDMPPVVTLFHELAHAYDQVLGVDLPDGHHAADLVWDGAAYRPAPGGERVAVGLPVDDDGRSATPDRLDPHHPYLLTENALRDELGFPLRETYGVAPPP